MKRPNFSKRYLILPVALIVFIMMFTMIYDDIKEKTISEFNNEQLILAGTASQGITSLFNDYQDDLTFLAQQQDMIAVNPNSEGLLARFYENHKNDFEALTRVDAHGIILFTYPHNDAVIGKDITYQKHVSQVIATHRPVISDVFIAAQGYPAIALHVPVFDGKEYKGSLAMLISINKLGKLYLGKIKIRGTGNVWLLSEKGIEIYCPDSGHTGKSFEENTKNDRTTLELSDKIAKNINGTGKSVHPAVTASLAPGITENYVVFYRAPLGNTYWTILISYQEKDIYVALTRMRNRLILVFVLLFISVAYYFYSLNKVRNLLKEEARRKRAERTLIESEDRFKKLSKLTFEGIMIHNQGIALDANESLINMVGYSREEMIGKDVIGLLVIPEFHELVKSNLKSDKPSPYEVIMKRKDGSLFPAELEAKNIRYNNENFRVAAVRDITERKQARETNRMMAEMLDTAPNAILVRNMAGQFLYANRKTFELHGYSESGFMAMDLHNLEVPGSEVQVAERSRLIAQQGYASYEVAHYHKNGHTFPLEVFAKSVSWKGEPAILSISSDITQRKQQEKELLEAKEQAEESDRLKSAFLANMSHEIRTPMNGILGFAGLLKEPGLNGDEQQEYIRIIEKSGNRMLNIINDIIDISKIESGQMEISLVETNINEQLAFIHHFFRPEAESKGLRLLLTNLLPAEEATVITDQEKIYAILSNLVKNSVKYTMEGQIEVGCNKEDGYLEFFVKDTGIGIPADRQTAIFERFVQSDISDKMAHQGAGLGLSITKAYAELLDGSINVESESGKGSKFSVKIPCSFSGNHVPAGINIPEEKLETQPGNLKILLAEDDKSSEMLITFFLKLFTREMLVTKTGMETVKVCRANPDIDLVLMDMQMPELNGYEATRQIREFNSNVIIIAQTAFALTGDREKAIKSGCNDYIVKPVKKQELLALINKYLHT